MDINVVDVQKQKSSSYNYINCSMYEIENNYMYYNSEHSVSGDV